VDVVDALVRLMGEKGAVGQVFNLGHDEEISIKDLAGKVVSICGSSSAIKYIPHEQAYGEKFDDMQRRVPKLDKIRGLINFKPRFNLEQIVRSVKESPVIGS